MNEKTTTNVNHIYSVLFYDVPLPISAPHQKFFLFTSLAAIYEVFTREQLGVSLKHLYNTHVANGSTYSGKRCIIRRQKAYSKKQQSPTHGTS